MPMKILIIELLNGAQQMSYELRPDCSTSVRRGESIICCFGSALNVLLYMKDGHS